MRLDFEMNSKLIIRDKSKESRGVDQFVKDAGRFK